MVEGSDQSAEEKSAQRMAKNIIDTILTLRCPNNSCRQAFVDFNGCYILNYHQCNYYFCRRCIKFNSRNYENVNVHVYLCDVMADDGQSYQRTNRSMLVIRRLQREDRNTINRVLSIIETNLLEIGVHISENDVWYSAQLLSS